jgi:hypothetical protein
MQRLGRSISTLATLTPDSQNRLPQHQARQTGLPSAFPHSLGQEQPFDGRHRERTLAKHKAVVWRVSSTIEVGLFRADAVVPEPDVVRGPSRAGAGAWGDLP